MFGRNHSRLFLLLITFLITATLPAAAAAIDLVTNGQAEQNSQLSGYSADRGINNNTGDFTHTLSSGPVPAVWQVLITNDTYSITNLVIYNRGQSGRLEDITIEVVEFTGDVTTDFALGSGGTVNLNTYTELGDYINPGNSGQNDTGVNLVNGNSPSRIEIDFVTMTGGPVVGNLIRIARTGSGSPVNDDNYVLSIAELYAYGEVYEGEIIWSNPGVSNITPFSADAYATLEGTNATGGWLYWDTTDKGETNTTWAYTNILAAVSTGLVESTISGLAPGATYYARFYGTNSTITNAGWSDAVSFSTEEVITNDAVADITSTSATFNATLHAPNTNYDVIVYWGTNDGGGAEGSWANTNYVDSYTNVATANPVFATVSLAADTEYHYTFRATNANGSFWATPSITFTTIGQPDINNGSGATTGIGYATLNGNLAGGTFADVYVYWGTIDGETNAAAWANTNMLGELGEGVFSTNTTMDLIYGVTYHYRCYATNALGSDWADTTATFLTAEPEDSGEKPMIGPGSDITDALQQDTPGQERLNVDRSTFTNLAAGTYNVDSFRLNVFEHTQGGTITPMLLTGAPSSYSTLWIGSAFDPTTNGEQTAPESGSFTLDAAANVYAGFFTAGSGSGIVALDQDNSGTGNSFTDHDNNFTAPTGPGQTVDGFSNANLQRTYAFVINIRIPASVGITNTAETGLTTTSATFNATLDAPGSVFDVTVYWGTNDGGIVASDWGNTNFIGSYTNVVSTNLSFPTNGLAEDVTYHYTFLAQNDATNMWADPSRTFKTLSQPSINNDTGATPAIGHATLNGELAAGSRADIYVYWGTSDGETNATSWANTNMLGELGEGAFSTNTTTDLIYGVTYYYRCYASNLVGADWANSTESFTTDLPVIPNYANGLYEWFFSNQGSDSQLDPIDAPTGWLTPPWSPDAKGILDEELSGNAGWAQGRASSAVIQPGSIDGNPGAVWFGKMQIGASGSGAPLEAGDITLASNSDDGSTVWVDRDQDGDFSHSGTSGDEMVVDNKGNHGQQWRYGNINLTAGVYDVAIGWRDNSGGNWIEAKWYQGVTTDQGVMTRIDPSNAGQDGMWLYISGTNAPAITNTAVTDLTTTSATLNATLEASASQFDVYAYWGTNDGGAAEGAWGNTNFIGTYTNVASTNLGFATNGLTQGGEYHYTFLAQNDATNMWATPSTTFTTIHQPTVDNGTGPVPAIGYATLNGELTSGTLADVFVYWGTTDGDTNATDWANTNMMGELAEGTFSTNTPALLYGVTYYYRCYATNAAGEDWADSTTNFTTLFPGPVYSNALRIYGYHINDDNNVMDLDNNGGMMGGGDPTTGPSYYGQGLLTSGPGDRGLDFNNDGDFQGTGAIGQNDNYSDMFLGHFLPQETGSFEFRRTAQDDATGMWIDRNRNGVFESSTPGLGSDRGEQLAWNDGNTKTVTLTNGLMYMVAFTHREGTAGSQCEFQFKTPSMGAQTVIKPSDPAQDGMWPLLPGTPRASIANTAASSLTTTSATFNAELNSTGSVFNVYVYWGTNDGGGAEGSWGNTNYVGSYTNDVSATPSFSPNGLAQGQQYYYTFVAQNPLTSLWASPSTTFTTIHQPAVNNGTGAVGAAGYATLHGELTDGSAADITVYWGAADGGTNAADWANTNVVGTREQVTFSTSTSTDLIFGVTYYYRCYATNEAGADWAPSTTNFTTLTPGVAEGISFLPIDGDDTSGISSNKTYTHAIDFGNQPAGRILATVKGVVFANGSAGTFPGTGGGASHTIGTGSSTLTGNHDGNDNADPYLVDGGMEDLVGDMIYNDPTGEILLTGLTPGQKYQFRLYNRNYATSAGGRDQDIGFDTDSVGSDISGAEHTAVFKEDDASAPDPSFATHSQVYALTYTYTLSPGVTTLTVYIDQTSTGSYHLYGLTNEELPPIVGIANAAVSSLSNTSATFNATLRGTQSVFDVYVYWGDSDGGTTESAWANTNYIGSYTNEASNDLGFATNGLTQDTEYHYAYLAQNQLTTMWATPSMTFTTDTVIANSAATDLSSTSAVCNAVLHAPVNDYDVYILWGDIDGGAADGAWANTNFVGSYTNVESTNISYAIGELSHSTPYYYTFRATEGSYMAWGHPSARFYTHGLPAVQNLGAVAGNGYALLSGELLSAGGAPTTVHVYWGDSDGDTNNADWAYTNIVASPVEGVPFSTSTTSNLIFGQQYYFRCFATNSNGVAWAESTAGFLVEPGLGAAPNLVAWWKFDEESGTTAVDSSASANQHDATLMGSSPAFQPTAGRFGGALWLPGDDEFAQAADHTDLEFPADESFSIAMWYKRNGVDNDEGLITKGYSWNPRNPAGYWLLQTRLDGFAFDTRQGANADPRVRIDDNSAVSHGDNQWHQFVFVRDSVADEMRIYIDNQALPATYDMSGDPPNDGDWAMGVHDDPLIIGDHNDRHTMGWFDDIGIWKGEALSAGDIYIIYNDGIAALNRYGVSIKNTAPTETYPDYSMNGTLNATQAVFDVYVYWGEIDGGANPGAWANTNFIGSYTNTNWVSLAFTTSELELGTTYHYTFIAQNLATNLGATPSESFTTALPEFVLPFVETFEDRTPGDLDGQYGWEASGTEVQGIITHLGSGKAACITGDTGEVSHSFVGGETDVWTDFYTKPTFGELVAAGLPTENTTAAFFVNTNGQVIAFDGWTSTELNHTPLVEGDGWVRFTVHSDYGDQEWDLYLNGKPIGLALDFYTNTASYTTFRVRNNGSTNNVYLDDIHIQLSPPSFAVGTVIMVR